MWASILFIVIFALLLVAVIFYLLVRIDYKKLFKIKDKPKNDDFIE